VDDATAAGARAARAARERGHAVTFFVCPGLVEAGLPHAAALLAALLDAHDARGRDVHEGRSYDLRLDADRRALRAALRRENLEAPTEADAIEAVRDLARERGLPPPLPPPHFATLSRADVVDLSRRGVSIGNHGWEHRHPPSLSADALAASIHRARRWIEDACGSVAPGFAAPFGLGGPPAGLDARALGPWFLLDESRPAGRLGGGVFNRTSLVLPVPGAAR
jgi:peptidoglycan/xylan/chitin deacetylase (PgdA/CDA1 family)